MSEEKNPKNNKEIDAFAKALLNKKTEIALNKEKHKTEQKAEPKPMTDRQREYAERTMSSALDLLRKERGQLTIEEEEQKFQEDQQTGMQPQEDLDDFTSDSIHQEPAVSPDTMNSIYSSIAHDQGTKKKKEKSKDKNKERKKPVIVKKKAEPKKISRKEKPKADRDAGEKDAKATQESGQEKGLKELSFLGKYWKPLFAAVAIFALLLGGYIYKTVVYDPANVVSEQQKADYDKFVEYADEWDMLSDAEKMELLDMEDAYTSLLEKQKKSLNDYFKEQTGETFTTRFDELKALRTQQEDETRPEYQQLVAYVSSWTNKSDEEKAQIVNYRDIFNSLSAALQQKIDQICMEQAGKNFNSLAGEEDAKVAQAAQEAAEQQAAQQKEQEERAAYNAQIQAQIDQLQSQLNDAVTYKSDLEAQQAAGEDVSAMITTNDQTISYLNQQIAALQATLR